MFENVIGLQSVTKDLERAIVSGTLPGAILLSGPRYGGKSTIALEIARSLTCHLQGEWDCRCRSCTLHRTLSHPDLVMAGPRYFDLEIGAALRAFGETPRIGTLYLLVRAVRKLLRRFDPHLWSETKLKKIQPAIDVVEAILQEMEPPPDSPGVSESGWKKPLKELEAKVGKLLPLVPREIVPVDLVRALASWAHVSSAGGTKIVLIEEVHTLQEGARNSMLKLLEEPPGDVFLLLTSSRRSAVIPTILSRLRTYSLPERTATEEAAVREKIFRADPGEGPLARFFRSAGAGDDDRRRALAERVVADLVRGADPGELLELVRGEFSEKNGGTREEFFFEELSDAARRRLRDADARDLALLQSWGAVIRAYRARIETRNMNPTSTISALVLTLHGMSVDAGA
ncbi:MAG: hypothetical protein EA427_08820 [Spirochaetaceae bacterium]|nr:MAG: hypothetical protein EA427_08820 [Spirochaetaceae bacterium]